MHCQLFVLIIISACVEILNEKLNDNLRKQYHIDKGWDEFTTDVPKEEVSIVQIVETLNVNKDHVSSCSSGDKHPNYHTKDIHNVSLESILLQSMHNLLCFLAEYFMHVFICLTVGIVVFILKKSYWCPSIYLKNLSDVGFEYIPKGETRLETINRVRACRQLGTKLPPPFPNGWFAVAESRELRIGQVTYVAALGENFAVFRCESGEVKCVGAYCPHLGANLGLGGKVRGECIECPFHEWRFNGDGVCTSIPGQDHPPKGISLKSWITKEVDYIVWIWHDAEGRQPLWSMETMPELKTWGYRGRNEFIINTHVQDITENGADIAHLNVIHAPSLLTKWATKYRFIAKLVGYHAWTADSSVQEDNTFVLNLKHEYKIGRLSLFHIDITSTQIGPAQVRMRVQTSGGPMMVLMTVTPISHFEQKAVFRFYSPFINAPIAVAFMLGESKQFERDVAIWNHKTYEGKPNYFKTDKVLRAFRHWFSQFYSENSISMKDAINKLNNPLDW